MGSPVLLFVFKGGASRWLLFKPYQWVAETVKLARLIVANLTVDAENRKAFAARLRLAMGDESARSLAKRVGVAPATINQYLSGSSEPTRPVLNGITGALNVSLEWLATGMGEMRPAAPGGARSPVSTAPELDEDLMARVVDGIMAAYKDAGQGLAPVHLGRMTARLVNEIVAASDGPEDYPGALKMRLAQLRKELQSAASDPASSKRSA